MLELILTTLTLAAMLEIAGIGVLIGLVCIGVVALLIACSPGVH